jgi:restriction endonuclease S subunit
VSVNIDSIINNVDVFMELSDFVEVSSGRTFANGVHESHEPTHKVIQLRDFEGLCESTNNLENLVGTNIESKRKINALQNNDVLVVAKGPIKKAVLLSDIPENIVPTQHFLFLRAKENSPISMKLVEFYLNSTPIQQWLKNHAGGTYQSTLTKKALKKLPFPKVTLEQEKLILETVDSINHEIELQQQLINSRNTQLDIITQRLMEK